jgi:uncharacterized protein (TIGR02284 family)
MEITEKSIGVLNDLVELNHDRVAGFEKASKDIEDGHIELKSLFEQYASESRTNASELSSAVRELGGEAETGTSSTADIHRAWIDVKSTFTGNDVKSILAECERGEDAIKKDYQSALSPEHELSFEINALLRKQQQGINSAHDQIKALRDNVA